MNFKKFVLVFVFIAMVFAGSGFCAETNNGSFIAITAPVSGTNWVKDTSKTITWDKIGDQDAFVNIQLFRGNSRVLDIIKATENNGFYEWIMPKTIKNGVYAIQISTLDEKVKNRNSILVVDGLIRITQPQIGITWINGTTQNITWTFEGKMHSKAKIQLYDGMDKVQDIATKVPINSGKFTWKIPITLAPSPAYFVQIVTKDGSVRDKSGPFSLPNGKAPVTKSSLEIEVWKGIWTLEPLLAKIGLEEPWEKSSEQNYGVSLRYKPKKSFSIGLSYQRIKGEYFYSEYLVRPDNWIAWDDKLKCWRRLDSHTEEREKADITGNVALFDLRWDIQPNWRIHPYFTFGLGAAFLNIVDDYYFCQRYVDPKDPSYKHPFEWIRTEGGLFDFDIPMLPVLELMFGLKIELLKKHLAIGIEGGFLDGIVYRGTLNFRF